MTQLSFSGHDTFHCRQFWLKKGLDYLWNNPTSKFNDDAVSHLGVGRNMVNSIKYWVNSFGLLKEGYPNLIAEYIFKNETGYDPYIEDINTLWLLHYYLVTTKSASIYSLVFNDFRRLKIEFTKNMLNAFLIKICKNANKNNITSKTLDKDINVFINNYTLPEKSKGIEADFSGLLYELNLLTPLERSGKDKWYKIENTTRPTLSEVILLFCILQNLKEGELTISFKELLEGDNSVGRVFALNANDLNEKLKSIAQLYPQKITFSDNAGVKVLQFKKTINPLNVLNDYYAQ
ncbi:MAG: DUF4007 family protein [Aureispira sp.]